MPEEKEVKTQKSISVEALRRMIEAGDLKDVKNIDTFMEKFAVHKHSIGMWTRNRAENLAVPLGEDEKNLMLDFISEGLTIPQLEEKYKIGKGSVAGKAGRAALKYLFHNREKMGI